MVELWASRVAVGRCVQAGSAQQRALVGLRAVLAACATRSVM